MTIAECVLSLIGMFLAYMLGCGMGRQQGVKDAFASIKIMTLEEYHGLLAQENSKTDEPKP